MKQTKTERELNLLTDLAKEWLELSRELRGWSTEEYFNENIRVRCYFADNSRHQSVDFGHRFSGEGLDIGFFNPVQVNFSIVAIPKFAKIYTDAKALLEEIKLEESNRDEKERQEAKANERRLLEERLQELNEA